MMDIRREIKKKSRKEIMMMQTILSLCHGKRYLALVVKRCPIRRAITRTTKFLLVRLCRTCQLSGMRAKY